MSVDFSRALKVKSPTKGIVTFYGLTTAPSHYVGFRSQSATRYIPMIANGGSVLFARIGGAQYGAYGTMTYTINFSNTKTKPWATYMYKSTLTTIANNKGGTNLTATVNIELLKENGESFNTKTATFDANTSSQTYDMVLYNWATIPYKIKVTVTVNGISKTTTVSYVQNGTQSASVTFQFAPWIN